MKNLNLAWSKAKQEAMKQSRGPIKGVVAIVVSEKLGGEYSTLAVGENSDTILATLPPSVGIYATLPSSNPEKIVSRILSLWEDDSIKEAPYSVASDGLVFHKAIPDHLLCDMLTSAWELFAEQYQIEIVEKWGTSTPTA